MMQIRRATLDDLKSVQELNHQLFVHDLPFDNLLNLEWSLQENGEEFFRSFITDNDKCCLVVENEGEIIGYLVGLMKNVSTWRKVRRAELCNILVLEKYRGSGAGKKLVKVFFEWGKEQKADKFFVSAYASNERAIVFYESLGFIPYEIELEKDVC